MTAAPRVASIQVGMPRTLPDGPQGKPWTTASFKDAVDGPVWLGATSLAGDGQADLANHGGPDKAVCAYPAAHYPYWRAHLVLPEMDYGAFGENFTVANLTEREVCIGDVFAVGQARVQVSQPRQPCWKLARRWGIRDLVARVADTGYTGWYFRVLEDGEVEKDLPLVLMDRPHEEWTVVRAHEVMNDRAGLAAAAELAALPALSARWRETLLRRAESAP